LVSPRIEQVNRRTLARFPLPIRFEPRKRLNYHGFMGTAKPYRSWGLPRPVDVTRPYQDLCSRRRTEPKDQARFTPELGTGVEVIVSIAGHVSHTMLSRTPTCGWKRSGARSTRANSGPTRSERRKQDVSARPWCLHQLWRFSRLRALGPETSAGAVTFAATGLLDLGLSSFPVIFRDSRNARECEGTP